MLACSYILCSEAIYIRVLLILDYPLGSTLNVEEGQTHVSFEMNCIKGKSILESKLLQKQGEISEKHTGESLTEIGKK